MLELYETANYLHDGAWYWVCGEDWSDRYYSSDTNARRGHNRTHKECELKNVGPVGADTESDDV